MAMNPALLAYLQQISAVTPTQGMAPPQAQPQAPQEPDPLAPLPEQRPDQVMAAQLQAPPQEQPAPEAPPSFDSPNQGINSVGRPSDESGKDDKAYKKARREAKGEALMAFGAELLSSPRLGEGLAKGLLAYTTTLHAARDRNLPKHETVGSGAFEKITDPYTGEVTYKRTPIADYDLEKQDRIFGNKLVLQDDKQEGDLAKVDRTYDRKGEQDKFTWGKREDIAKLGINSRENIARARNSTALAVANIRGANKGRSSGIEKQVTELSGDVVNINNTLARGQPVLESIRNGQLSFSIVNNARNKAAVAGLLPRNEQTVLYSNYQTFKEQLRGAWLMAFKGVQTEGDAQRAMDSIIAGEGDGASVKANLETVINAINAQLAMKQKRLDELGTVAPSEAPAASPATDLKKKYGLE